MNRQWLLLFAVLPFPAAAQMITPTFTQGSNTSTTVTNQVINETTTTQRFGGDYTNYSGENVTPSGAINATGTTYSVTTAGEAFQLETTVRAAGLVEQIDTTRTITTDATTNSYSVFSQ